MTDTPTPDYEADELVAQYLFFHYGSASDQFPYALGAADGLNFPQRCAALALDNASPDQRGSVLDLGCGVGASAVALSPHFDRVLALDYSRRFIEAARQLMDVGQMQLNVPDEANQVKPYAIALPADSRPERIEWMQGDAQKLPSEIGPFDLVLACNLLCRLSRPLELLKRLPALVTNGGTLLISTPLTWLDGLTPIDERIGDADNSAMAVLERQFAGNFRLLKVTDMPFLIREHRRKFQYGIAQASVWRRIKIE